MVTTPSRDIVPNYGMGLTVYVSGDTGPPRLPGETLEKSLEDLRPTIILNTYERTPAALCNKFKFLVALLKGGRRDRLHQKSMCGQ
jgi:hypothetical protein